MIPLKTSVVIKNVGVISVHQVWVLIFQVCWSEDALVQVWFCMLGKCLERELLHRSKMNVDVDLEADRF